MAKIVKTDDPQDCGLRLSVEEAMVLCHGMGFANAVLAKDSAGATILLNVYVSNQHDLGREASDNLVTVFGQISLQAGMEPVELTDEAASARWLAENASLDSGIDKLN